MTELIRRFPEAVSGPQGVFLPRVMARKRGDGTWEGWLQFNPVGVRAATGVVTGIETLQHDRTALERWASGLTRVYAEGALARARAIRPGSRASELQAALNEIVEALDRAIPGVERGSAPDIAADAKRLRAEAVRRLASLRRDLSASRG